MKDKERYINLAKHCVGLDKKKPYKRHGRLFYKPYRNYFDAGKSDMDSWTRMWEQGYAEKGKKNRYGECMFWLSRKGMDWLGNELGIVIHDEED